MDPELNLYPDLDLDPDPDQYQKWISICEAQNVTDPWDPDLEHLLNNVIKQLHACSHVQNIFISVKLVHIISR
jgi:hypothetical protein